MLEMPLNFHIMSCTFILALVFPPKIKLLEATEFHRSINYLLVGVYAIHDSKIKKSEFFSDSIGKIQ